MEEKRSEEMDAAALASVDSRREREKAMKPPTAAPGAKGGVSERHKDYALSHSGPRTGHWICACGADLGDGPIDEVDQTFAEHQKAALDAGKAAPGNLTDSPVSAPGAKDGRSESTYQCEAGHTFNALGHSRFDTLPPDHCPECGSKKLEELALGAGNVAPGNLTDSPVSAPGAKESPFTKYCYKSFGLNDYTCRKLRGHEGECGPIWFPDAPPALDAGKAAPKESAQDEPRRCPMCGSLTWHGQDLKPPPASFAEGKKIYDQGWNDGIDHLNKLIMLAVEQRLGR